MKKAGQITCAVICGLFIAAQVFAWQNHYLLPGMILYRFLNFKVYAPHDYLFWLWRWVFTYPASFQWSGLTFLIACVIPILVLRPKPVSDKPVAVWATLQSLKKAKLLRPRGIRLGSFFNRLVRAFSPGHLFILASTQSGKTAGLVIPSILDGLEKSSIIVHDPKEPGEIYEATAGYRSTFSKVILFQPLNPLSQQYNPLDAVRLRSQYEIRDMQIIADMLIDPDGELTRHSNEGTVHFSQIGSDILNGVITHAMYTWPGCSLADIHLLLCGEMPLDALMKEMRQALHVSGACHPSVIHASNVFAETAEKELSAIRNTAKRALRLWSDPLVCRATEKSDFSLHDLREGNQPISLYLSFPFADQDRLRPLSRLVIRQCLEYSAHKKYGWKFPLTAVLDEFQALGHLPILRYGLNYFLGMGVTMCLITPSMHEIIAIWGQHHPFLEGTATKVVFGIRDETIAEKFTRPIGTHPETFTRTSTSNDGGLFSSRSTTITEERDQPLFSAQALMQLDEAKVLARIGTQQVLLDKTSFYDNPKLLQRSKMEVSPHGP